MVSKRLQHDHRGCAARDVGLMVGLVIAAFVALAAGAAIYDIGKWLAIW